MAEITTNATVEGEKIAASVDYNIGQNLDEACQEYGDDCVWGLYVRGATLALQQKMGQVIRAGGTQDDVTVALADYRLDQRGTRVRKSKEEKARDVLGNMSADQIRALLEGMGMKVK